MKETACLLIETDGRMICLHTELITLAKIGRMETARVTEVEFDPQHQQWQVRTLADDQIRFRHPSRVSCLDWERRTFNRPDQLRHFQNKHREL